MLTLQQAYEVKAAITEYMRATFSFKERQVSRAFQTFIMDQFKGPYLSLRLPFVKADPAEPVPLEIAPDFLPFSHQVQAFKRLSTADGHAPEPTLLTTGTGSGKTEAFLYPILDYCYQHRDQFGVKVIILYPMNALATDQAKRLAEVIHSDERLAGRVRAGLFIGESRDRKKSYPRLMGPDYIIENRDEILASPPDILLTNFKMLDFSLMQARYHSLWQHNIGYPERLKFLVLDELHTYQGAQGSDVAMLIRRLKLKLNTLEGYLCPIGTSATIGKGEESRLLMAEFAGRIFGETVTPEAVIEEHRLSPDAFFTAEVLRPLMPAPDQLATHALKSGDDFQQYLQAQLTLWGLDPEIDPVALGEELRSWQIVKDLVSVCSEGMFSIDQLIVRLGMVNRHFAALPDQPVSGHFSTKEAVIQSIVSLISHAKSRVNDRVFPFLYVQAQLWIRELSGLVRVVQQTPAFKWRQDIDVQNSEKALPPWYCRECGATGWLAVKQENKDQFENDINDVYHKYFSHHKNLWLVVPDRDENRCIEEYEVSDTIESYVNPNTLALQTRGNADAVKIIAYRKINGNYNLHICPGCNSKNTLNIMGTRVSTLTSIAISQLLATDLDARAEKQRKVLAFTNSVQDAAHQAGFIQARNVRFTFRTALQKVINLQPGPLDLTTLQEAFISYWQSHADESGQDHLEAYVFKFFPPDHASDADPGDYKQNPVSFIQEFNHRIGWEIAAEFGYNAMIGRTLEKTGSSAVFFAVQPLETTWQTMQPWLLDNALGGIDRAGFLQFLLIFLHRLRRRGGVDHPYLQRFRSGRSSYYLLTQAMNPHHFLMRNFGKDTRLPKFITDTPNRYGVFDLTQRTTSINWFHAYFIKAFPLAPGNADLVNEFYSRLLDVLASAAVHLLNEKMADGIRNAALRPEQLFVSRDVTSLECDRCGDTFSTTPHNADLLKDAVCSVYRCTGHYRLNAAYDRLNYYQQVYNRGRAPRVYAADHTGLLDRRVREELEIEYKTRPRFNSTNVMVATSTLEMGIDIGTLNSAINTSVPPLPANFLQRIGRAGRSSGSAIVLNFVPANAHDLYYFESPLEMMDGQVNTPGCYLEAKEILRRHFFAFCIDRWTALDPERHVIPSIIRHLKMENLDLSDASFFVNLIIQYIRDHQAQLLDDFQHSFKNAAAAGLFSQLALQLQNDRLFAMFRHAFISLKQEILNLRQKQTEIKDYVKVKNLDVADPEYLELQREHRNISAMIMGIRRQQVLEHLINEGLLPNYAFPETGVTLKAQVGRRFKQGPRGYGIKTFQVVRPARSALRELVPDNHFYTQGYKFKVSGVNIASWAEEVIDFRFCSSCDHWAEDIPPVASACPKCGSATWRSAMNTHKVLRMQAVNSFVNDKEARVDDSAEERERRISSISRHFKFNANAVHGSWAMAQIGFGIEYVKEVQLLELNTGLSDSRIQHNNILTINNVEVPRSGFIVCKNCGKATTSIYDEQNKLIPAGAYHFGFCKNKDKNYQLKPDDVFEEIFFNRSMSTEAIKVLLPVQELDTESALKLFKAGIGFGLRKYFRGNPDHLEIAEYSEYNQKTQRHDQYLVLFDVIPGGTGYLSKLFNKDEFNRILTDAYINIRDCTCQYRNKDGCYNCIYTYGNQFEREILSRSQAEKLFEKIYQSTQQWEYSDQGLGSITTSGRIEESELEERFIRLLAAFCSDEARPQFKFQTLTEDGFTFYNMEYHQDQKTLSFEIRPQVEVGPADGVRYTTIADFMITCIGLQQNGQEQEIMARFKPIAVYLDGYQFHASRENNRFPADLAKRTSILDSNRYWTWVLTWSDLDRFEAECKNENGRDNDFLKERLDHDVPERSRQRLYAHPLLRDMDRSLEMSGNSMTRLLRLLQHFDRDDLEETVKRFLFLFQSDFPNRCLAPQDSRLFIESWEKSAQDYIPVRNEEAWCPIDLIKPDDFYEFRLLQELKSLACHGALYLDTELEEYEKGAWERFWAVFNMLQASLHDLLMPDFLRAEAATETVQEEPDDVLGNFAAKYHPLVRELMRRKIAFNTDDYFHLKDKDGVIIAEAFLGLPDRRIVIDPLDEASRQIFAQQGYSIHALEDVNLDQL